MLLISQMTESSGLVTVVGEDGKTYVADQKTVQAKQVQQMVAQGGALGIIFFHLKNKNSNLPKNCQYLGVFALNIF